MNIFPNERITICNSASVNAEGKFVLYWMIAARRVQWNFALERAVEWSCELNKPLVILEALRCGYQWASDRFHAFIINGMHDNQNRIAKRTALYYPYLEPEHDEGKGLLTKLSEYACIVVTDDFPTFFLPRAVEAASSQVKVCLEAVDSNGLLPMSCADRAFLTAYSFRRYLQKTLRDHLSRFPKSDPLKGVKLPTIKRLPADIIKRWRATSLQDFKDGPKELSKFPIDHSVSMVSTYGGCVEANSVLESFLHSRLARYAEGHNHPDEDACSLLSPYLHFGHISVHQVFYEIMTSEGWAEHQLSLKANGSRSAWWGVSQNIEAFLDQLVTWRELGFNMCRHSVNYDSYDSLPEWAKKTLADHQSDPRQYVYSLNDLERAKTHDELWNAAQNELLIEGRIHNYLRMLWGKKILEWSLTPQKAIDVMIYLNNKYALDGRDPNSYSGIFWILGRYDRPWGPERPIFGKVRYMSSNSAKRKLRLKEYLSKYGVIGLGN